MKNLFIALMCLTSLNAIAQNQDIVDVIIDDKPAKLNTKTGAFSFTGKAPRSNEGLNTTVSVQSFDGELHTVSKGDTFYSISKRYGISIAQLKSLNTIKSNNLRIGQQLKIGYSNNSISTVVTHTVVKGETLYRIATNNNLTVARLKTLNNLTNNTISIGQVLKLQ